MANCKVIEDGTLFTRYQKIDPPARLGGVVMEQLIFQLNRKPDKVQVPIPNSFILLMRNDTTGVFTECWATNGSTYQTTCRELQDRSLYIVARPLSSVAVPTNSPNSIAIPFEINVKVPEGEIGSIPAKVTVEVSYTPEIANPPAFAKKYQNNECTSYAMLNTDIRKIISKACENHFNPLLQDKYVTSDQIDGFMADTAAMDKLLATINDQLSMHGCELVSFDAVHHSIFDRPGSKVWSAYDSMKKAICQDGITGIQMKHDKDFHAELLKSGREMRDNEKKYNSDLEEE